MTPVSNLATDSYKGSNCIDGQQQCKMCLPKVKFIIVWLLFPIVISSFSQGVHLPFERIGDQYRRRWPSRNEEMRQNAEDPFEIVAIERDWDGSSWDLQFTAFER